MLEDRFEWNLVTWPTLESGAPAAGIGVGEGDVKKSWRCREEEDRVMWYKGEGSEALVMRRAEGL